MVILTKAVLWEWAPNFWEGQELCILRRNSCLIIRHYIYSSEQKKIKIIPIILKDFTEEKVATGRKRRNICLLLASVKFVISHRIFLSQVFSAQK